VELQSWVQILKASNLETSTHLGLSNMLADSTVINGWNRSELPGDEFSLDNAVIMLKSDRYTLSIDPNNQASNFLRKKIENVDNKKPVRLSSTCLNYEQEVKNVKMALKLGNIVCMENFTEPINPLVKALVLNRTYTRGNATCVLVEGEEVEVHKEFQMYLVSPNPRPVYSLQVWLNLRLINFAATTTGL